MPRSSPHTNPTAGGDTEETMLSSGWLNDLFQDEDVRAPTPTPGGGHGVHYFPNMAYGNRSSYIFTPITRHHHQHGMVPAPIHTPSHPYGGGGGTIGGGMGMYNIAAEGPSSIEQPRPPPPPQPLHHSVGPLLPLVRLPYIMYFFAEAVAFTAI